jgi:2-methylcitrate dehydratase PrpD
MRAAIGLSTSLSSGLQLNFGTMTKAIQVGNASRSGVIAAQLAKEGCTANLDALGDPMGFGYAFYSGQFKSEKIVNNLGNPLSIIFPGIGMKIHPCCGLTHSSVDIMVNLVREHNISYHEVEKVEVYTEELVPSVLVHHEPKTGYEGKYSLEYVVAAVLFDRKLTPGTFTDSSVNRPEIQNFMKKVECRVRPDAEWADMRLHPWNHPAHVIITLKNGLRYTGKAACARGYPDLPLTEEEIITKFRYCSGFALSENTAARLIGLVLNLEAHAGTADIIMEACEAAADRSVQRNQEK